MSTTQKRLDAEGTGPAARTGQAGHRWRVPAVSALAQTARTIQGVFGAIAGSGAVR